MAPSRAVRSLAKVAIVTTTSVMCVYLVSFSVMPRTPKSPVSPEFPASTRLYRQSSINHYVIEANAQVIRPEEYTLRWPVEFNGTRSRFKSAQQLWYHIDDAVREQGYHVRRKSMELAALLEKIPSADRSSLVSIINELVLGNEEFNFVVRNRLRELVDGQGLFNDSEQVISRLASVVDDRIEKLQSGSCSGALYCKPGTPWGFASGIHSAAYCLVRGFRLGRRVEFDFSEWHYLANSTWTDHFMALSNGSCDPSKLNSLQDLPGVNGPKRRSIFILPVDLAELLSAHIRDPYVWWIGRFIKYILRPSFQTQIELSSLDTPSSMAKVALQIRHGDKVLHEADYHDVDEYMHFVNDYIQTYGHKAIDIFVATDDPRALEELKSKYGDLNFTDNGSATLAGSEQRDAYGAISNIQKDLHRLSTADFLVCTLSSGMCRLAFELMAALSNSDVHDRVVSLDVPLFYAYVAHPPRLALYYDPGVTHETGDPRERLALYPGALLAARYDRSSINDVKGSHFDDGLRVGRYLESNTLSGNPYVSWKTVPTLHVDSSWKIL